MFPWTMANVRGPTSEDPKLIIWVITFEVIQPVWPVYVNVSDTQMDGRTDNITIAIPRYMHICTVHPRSKMYFMT